MDISILTLFPDMFSGPFAYSIVKRAGLQGKVAIRLVNIRDFATDTYRTVDDHPYGGGPGMILRVDVVDRCLTAVLGGSSAPRKNTRIILMDAGGTPFSHATAAAYSKLDHLVILCGHYEGVDARITDLVDGSVSVGDFVVTGGELPAMLITDAVIRLLPGVLSDTEATRDESFASGRLEYPQYTRPETYNGLRVPEILLSGNHKAIDVWREQQAIARTKSHRPDLLTGKSKKKRVRG